jgi:hypothetical protein
VHCCDQRRVAHFELFLHIHIATVEQLSAASRAAMAIQDITEVDVQLLLVSENFEPFCLYEKPDQALFSQPKLAQQ